MGRNLGYKARIMEEFRDLLGKVPDGEIAKKVGCGVAMVGRIRAGLGIKRYEKASPLEEYKHLLGKAPDSRIADISGMSPTAVFAARQSLGIPPFRKHGARRVKRGFPRKLLGVSGAGIKRVMEDMLSMENDSEIARKYGVSRQAVEQARRCHGIKKPSKTKRVLAGVLAMMKEGKSVAEMAKALGVGENFIRSAACRGAKEAWEAYPYKSGKIRLPMEAGAVSVSIDKYLLDILEARAEALRSSRAALLSFLIAKKIEDVTREDLVKFWSEVREG